MARPVISAGIRPGFTAMAFISFRSSAKGLRMPQNIAILITYWAGVAWMVLLAFASRGFKSE